MTPAKISKRQLMRNNKLSANENKSLRKEIRYIAAHFYLENSIHKVFDEMNKEFLKGVVETSFTLKPEKNI